MSRSQQEFRTACVVSDALKFGARTDVPWSHFPAGEKRSAITGARLQRMGLARGWPDYVFIPPGANVPFLELKSPGGYLTPEQMAFRDRVLANGCKYEVARTGQEAIEILRSWGILERVRVAA